MLGFKSKGLAMTLAFIFLFLAMFSNNVSLAQGQIPVVSNYEGFKDYIKDSILNQKKNIEVRVKNYNSNVYSFSQVINDLAQSDPETNFLFGRGYNGRVSGLSNSSDRVITYDFEYRNEDLAHKLKEVPKVTNSEDLKNVVKKDFQNYRKNSLIKIIGYNRETYNLGNLVEETLMENPGYGTGYKGIQFTIYGQGNDVIVQLTYRFDYPMEQIIQMRTEADLKATRVVESLVKQNMKDYEKLLILHNYIVNNTAYDIQNYRNGTIPSTSRSVYGVLINGIAVCEGYANALKKLLDLAGVESMMVVGRTQTDAHAWNLVKIGGAYYHVDATWNDPITSSGRQILRHDYFNVTDAVLEKTHQWDRSQYPFAGSTQYNYENVLKAIEKDKLAAESQPLLGGTLGVNQAIEKPEEKKFNEPTEDFQEKNLVDGVLANLELFVDEVDQRIEKTLTTIILEEDEGFQKATSVDGLLREDGEPIITNDLKISPRILLIQREEDDKVYNQAEKDEINNINDDFRIESKENQLERSSEIIGRRIAPLLLLFEKFGFYFGF